MHFQTAVDRLELTCEKNKRVYAESHKLNIINFNRIIEVRDLKIVQNNMFDTAKSSAAESPLNKELTYAKKTIKALELMDPQLSDNACIVHGKKHAWIRIKTCLKKTNFYLFMENGAICVDLYIGGRGKKEANQLVFDRFFARKTEIESLFDKPISWVRKHPKSSQASRIIIRNTDFLDNDFSNSKQALTWAVDNLIKLYQALSPQLCEILEKYNQVKKQSNPLQRNKIKET